MTRFDLCFRKTTVPVVWKHEGWEGMGGHVFLWVLSRADRWGRWVFPAEERHVWKNILQRGGWKPQEEISHCHRTPGRGGRVGQCQGSNPHRGPGPSFPLVEKAVERICYKNHRRRRRRKLKPLLRASHKYFMQLPGEELLHSRKMPPGYHDSESDLQNNSPN